MIRVEHRGLRRLTTGLALLGLCLAGLGLPAASAADGSTDPAVPPLTSGPVPSGTTTTPGTVADEPTPTQAPTSTQTPTPSQTRTPTQKPEPPLSAIDKQYKALGGESVLGPPLAAESCTLPGGACWRDYRNGSITSSTASGAVRVAPQVLTRWKAQRTTFGAATGVMSVKANGSYAQKFTAGVLAGTPQTGTVPVGSYVLSAWNAAGGLTSILGAPLGEQKCGLVRGGCVQNFENNRQLTYSAATGARMVFLRGAIGGKWTASGGAGNVGWPVSAERCGLVRGGCVQDFQYGSVYWNGRVAAIIRGGVKGRWVANGAERGFLGYPTTDEKCGLKNGGCIQTFERGRIAYSPATGAWPVFGGLAGIWDRQGGQNGALGYPTSGEFQGSGVAVQRFQGGQGVWSAQAQRTAPYTECETLNNGRSVYGSRGSKAVTFAVAERYRSSNATVIRCDSAGGQFYQDWRIAGFVGSQGFKAPGVPSGPTRYEYSPTGSYTVTQAFGLGNPGTRLPYQTLNPRSRWGGNPWTATYNKYHESNSWVGWDENMWYFATRSTRDYLQGAVINYNRPPDSGIVQDAGFAIFLHENPVPTAGCVAINHNSLVDWLKKATPGDRITMGVRSALFR